MGRTAGSKNKVKHYEIQKFESRTNKGKYVRLFCDMTESNAWKQLTKNARLLYLYMKMQFNGKGSNGLQIDQFVFNKAMYMTRYKLYTNQAQFYKDRDLLILYGFIEVVQSGKNTRTKSIYKFSDKWQTIDIDLVNNELRKNRK